MRSKKAENTQAGRKPDTENMENFQSMRLVIIRNSFAFS